MLSLILSVALMLSLCAQFDLTVFAEEEAATGSQIYAFLNKIDNGKDPAYNLELVFKNENVKDANYYAGPYTDFADTEYVTTTYKFDNNCRPGATWNYHLWEPNTKTSLEDLPPWQQDSNRGYNIRKVTFKNKIAPKSIAGWFYGCQYLYEFVGLEENLDTSR